MLLGQTDKKKDQKKSDPYSKWKNMKFRTTYLEGHNDLVYSVATDGEYVVTGR